MLRLTVLFAVYLLAYTCQTQANPLTEGLSTFASDLYKQCVKSSKNTNVFISPFCVSNALALLAQGSKGDTYNQLKNGLHFKADNALMPVQFNETYNLLSRGAGSSKLNVANKVYLQNGIKINKDFKNVASKMFHSDIESINFGENQNAASTMNRFVEEKTNNMVKNFIEPSMLATDSRLVLINVLYFKGNWEYPFDEKKTAKGTFHLNKATTVETDFMFAGNDFNFAYIEELKATAVQLKYKNSQLSFVIVLPNKDKELEELESKLENYSLNQITEQMEPIDVDLYVPKFKLQYEVSLKAMLTNMGMGSIFSPNAKLNGLIDSNEELMVDDVIHKTVIDVNERGSEAAAASGVQISAYSYPANFTADRPFYFYIWDESTKMPIFTGRFVNFEATPKLPPKIKVSRSAQPPPKIVCAWYSWIFFKLLGCEEV